MSSATAPSPLPVPPAISRARRAGGSPGPHLTGGEARRHGSHAVTQHERPRRGPESCPGRAHSPLCTAVQSLLRCHGNEPLMTGCILQSSTAAAADGRPFRPRRSARRLFCRTSRHRALPVQSRRPGFLSSAAVSAHGSRWHTGTQLQLGGRAGQQPRRRTTVIIKSAAPVVTGPVAVTSSGGCYQLTAAPRPGSRRRLWRGGDFQRRALFVFVRPDPTAAVTGHDSGVASRCCRPHCLLSECLQSPDSRGRYTGRRGASLIAA